MNYVVVLGTILAVHVLAMISPSPNVLVVTQTAISQTRRIGAVTALVSRPVPLSGQAPPSSA
jgi:threonine/homoserine/homoserine lactone efflux protein